MGKTVNTMSFLKKLLKRDYVHNLEKYGQLGVDVLANATPKASGLTASSWEYQVTVDNEQASIVWTNSHVVDGVNIAVILNYGHGTRGGTWVEGRNYISPAVRPMFDSIANQVWEEVVG